MRSLTKIIGGTLLLLTLSVSAFATTNIVMSNDNNAKGLKGQTFDLLSDEIKERLGDKVKIFMHHSGSLFDQKTQIQGLQLGSINIIAPTAGIYAPVAPKVGALLLPFLLTTPEAINAAMQDEIVRSAFIPDLESKNIMPIAVWMNGARSFGHKGRQPALTPDAWKGMKIRVQPSPIFVNTMEAIGASVIGMSWSEVPTALQQGVIDAAEPTPNAWKGSGIYKMVDHIILNEYVYSFYIVGVNKMWWNGLSTDVKDGIKSAMDVTTAWNWEQAKNTNEADIKTIVADGTPVYHLTTEQKKAWKASVATVWKSMGDDLVGTKVMNRLREISDQYVK